jgi:hypothetical protein
LQPLLLLVVVAVVNLLLLVSMVVLVVVVVEALWLAVQETLLQLALLRETTVELVDRLEAVV